MIARDFKTGTDGLVLELVEGLPPDEVYEANSFRIGLKIQNRGAYDISRGEIKIAGFNEEFTNLERWQSTMKSLQGRSVTAPEGDFYIEEFQGMNEGIPEGASEFIEKFYVYSEYDYETVANRDICINPNFYDVKSSLDSCEPTDSISLSGQGAPVAVSRIEQVISPESENRVKLQFKLTIENKGDGEVVSPVRIEEVKIGNRRLQCEPRTLDLEKSKTVICTGTEFVRGAYTTPFSAQLSYRYQTKLTGKLTIKSLKVS